MRGIFTSLCLLALLAGCIPGGGNRTPEPPREPPRLPGSAPQATLQCHLDLARERIGFRVLPDRQFGDGCSALGAVQLTEIGTPTTNLGAMTCPLALHYARWVRQVVQPAARQALGESVARVETFGTYACRTRNSRPGARLSEHGRANAVDVAAFVLADGRRITVMEGWNGEDGRVRRFLRAVHRGGCERFATTIGPDGDSYHANHLHFDMGQGPYCR
jgi:hypothetical protein